jgi:hypothetical protein
MIIEARLDRLRNVVAHGEYFGKSLDAKIGYLVLGHTFEPPEKMATFAPSCPVYRQASTTSFTAGSFCDPELRAGEISNRDRLERAQIPSQADRAGTWRTRVDRCGDQRCGEHAGAVFPRSPYVSLARADPAPPGAIA